MGGQSLSCLLPYVNSQFSKFETTYVHTFDRGSFDGAMHLMHIWELDYITMECTMCRMDLCDSDIQVADGKHVIKLVHATADILDFWELLSCLHLGWE